MHTIAIKAGRAGASYLGLVRFVGQSRYQSRYQSRDSRTSGFWHRQRLRLRPGRSISGWSQDLTDGWASEVVDYACNATAQIFRTFADPVIYAVYSWELILSLKIYHYCAILPHLHIGPSPPTKYAQVTSSLPSGSHFQAQE